MSNAGLFHSGDDVYVQAVEGAAGISAENVKIVATTGTADVEGVLFHNGAISARVLKGVLWDDWEPAITAEAPGAVSTPSVTIARHIHLGECVAYRFEVEFTLSSGPTPSVHITVPNVFTGVGGLAGIGRITLDGNTADACLISPGPTTDMITLTTFSGVDFPDGAYVIRAFGFYEGVREDDHPIP